jgi:pSer/pThr/pTyr-binding forkhead associated (FHA) protein
MATIGQTLVRTAGNLGSSFKLLAGGNVPNYRLKFLENTLPYASGTSELIVGTYIELGRGATCGLRFGEQYKTVSRQHAAIERRKDGVYLIHLSASNPTYHNGQALSQPNQAQKLQNNDTIQLTSEGPKLQFTTSLTKTSSLSTTQRVQMAMQQGIRPYRNGMIAIVVMLLVAIGGIVYQQTRITEAILAIDKLEQVNQAQADSLRQANKRNTALAKQLEDQVTKLKGQLDQTTSQLEAVRAANSGPKAQVIEAPDVLAAYNDDVYLIQTEKIVITYPNGKQETIETDWQAGKTLYTGTAFLLEDGRLASVLHVLYPWGAITQQDVDEENIFYQLNEVHNNGGKVVLHLVAVSPNKTVIRFTTQNVVKGTMVDVQITNSQGQRVVLEYLDEYKNDWAYVKTSQKGKIKFDGPGSKTLKKGTPIYILGYSMGLRYVNLQSLDPVYSESMIAQDNLSTNGMILIGARTFEGGNSGGPGFVIRDGVAYAVGMVSISHGNAQQQTAFGSLAPIAYIN